MSRARYGLGMRTALVAFALVPLTACAGGGSENPADTPAALGGALDPYQARLRIYAVYDLWNRHADEDLGDDAGAIAATTRAWIEEDGDAALAYVNVGTASTPGAMRDPAGVYIFGPVAREVFVVAVPSDSGPRYGVVDPDTMVVDVVGQADLVEYERTLNAALHPDAA